MAMTIALIIAAVGIASLIVGQIASRAAEWMEARPIPTRRRRTYIRRCKLERRCTVVCIVALAGVFLIIAYLHATASAGYAL